MITNSINSRPVFIFPSLSLSDQIFFDAYILDQAAIATCEGAAPPALVSWPGKGTRLKRQSRQLGRASCKQQTQENMKLSSSIYNKIQNKYGWQIVMD